MTTNKKYSFDTKNATQLAESIPPSYGLFCHTPAGAFPKTREEREMIWRKILQNRIMLIMYKSKTSKTGRDIQRYVTLNRTWIDTDPDEMIRKRDMDEKRRNLSVQGLIDKSKTANTKASGVLSVYDIEKPGWISFDVDRVLAANGIKSDRIKLTLKYKEDSLDSFQKGLVTWQQHYDRMHMHMHANYAVMTSATNPHVATGVVPVNSGPVSITKEDQVYKAKVADWQSPGYVVTKEQSEWLDKLRNGQPGQAIPAVKDALDAYLQAMSKNIQR